MDTLIQAFESGCLDSSCRFLAIGPSEERALSERLQPLGVLVRIVPWTDGVWGHLAAFDVLCLPSIREGFPMVVLEAAAAEVPTITTRATAAIDSVIPGVTGLLIDVGDVNALVTSINDPVVSVEWTAELEANANKRARTEFKQERIWRGIPDVLEGQFEPRDSNAITRAVPVAHFGGSEFIVLSMKRCSDTASALRDLFVRR